MNFTNVCRPCPKLFEACNQDYIRALYDSLGYRLDCFGNLKKPANPDTHSA